MGHGTSTTFSAPGEAGRVRGKSAHIDVAHNLEDQVITSITSSGRDAPMQAESERSNTILHMLQRLLPLFDNHWMQAIWFPDQPVNWPVSFSTSKAPTIEILEHPNVPLNESQNLALTKMLSPTLDTAITLVKGPPGTGKTTVIATYVISAIAAGKRGIWLMAQSNVAVKNIAEKLVKLGFLSFKLIVSQNFHYQWWVTILLRSYHFNSFVRHEHLYEEIKSNIIVSTALPKQSALKKVLNDSQVILCTLDMLSNPKLKKLGLTVAIPIINVIIDEASQIEVGQYVPLFKLFGHSLRKLCFIGDDNQCRSLSCCARRELNLFQVPPHAQDNLLNLQSIFELTHLKESVTFLDTQCESPIPARNALLIDRAFETVCRPKLVTSYPNMSTKEISSQTLVIGSSRARSRAISLMSMVPSNSTKTERVPL
jgi:AAA domain